MTDHLLQKAVFASGEIVQDHLPDCSAGRESAETSSMRKALQWMLEVAEARNTDRKARTVNLKFSRATLSMWQEEAKTALNEPQEAPERSSAHRCKRAGGFVDSSCTAICDCHITLALSRPAPQAAREIDRDAVAAIVLKAMQAKVDPDAYGASYAIKINADRAVIAADSILALTRPKG